MFFGTRNSLVYVKIRQNYQKLLFWPFLAKNSRKSRHFGQKTKFPILTWYGSIYMVFGTRNSLVYVKICQNYQKLLFWPFFGQKWPKILIFWPKNKISDFDMIGVYIYVFGTRNSLVYVKTCQNYQKPLFWPFFGKK